MEHAADNALSTNPEVSAEIAQLVGEARAAWERQALFDSERPLSRALELAEASLGVDDPLVASVLSHLGWLAMARKQHDVAVSHHRRALAIRETQLGAAHPDTLHSVEELAAALFELDARGEEADVLARRAIAAHETAGRDDPEFAELLGTVGWRRYWIGHYAEAEPLLLRSLSMRERLLGIGHAATAANAQQLAIMYDHRSGFEVDPEPFYVKALMGFEAALGPDHASVFEARYRFADYLERQGRSSDAAPLFDDLIARILSDGPPVSPDTVFWMLGAFCDYLRGAGRDVEVDAIEVWAASADPFLEMSRSAVAQAEIAHGPESAELADALRNLTSTYACKGRPDEAEAAARRHHAVLSARLGPDDPATLEAAASAANIRAFAESQVTLQPTRQRFGLDLRKLFDGEPWRDERRPDLIRAYLTERDDDDSTGAQMAIVTMNFTADLDEQWDVILELISEAPEDGSVLQAIAAGPLEGFLGRFDEEVIDRVEARAERDPHFRRVLSGVWKHGMSDPVWKRVRAMQETVVDPLPEMRQQRHDER